MPQIPLQGGSGACMAWKVFGPLPKKFFNVFGFNQVGSSEYKELLKSWLKILWYSQFSHIIQDIAAVLIP